MCKSALIVDFVEYYMESSDEKWAEAITIIEQKILSEKISELILEYISDDDDFNIDSLITSLDIVCTLIARDNDGIPQNIVC